MPINENTNSDVEPLTAPVEQTNEAVVNPEGSQSLPSQESDKQPIIENDEKNAETPVEEKAIKVPERYEGESDIQYSYRMQMFQTKQQIENAESPEEESLLRKSLKEQRKALASHSGKTETTSANSETKEEVFTDDEAVVIKENLRKMGFVSADEIENYKQQIREDVMREMRASQTQNEHTDAIKTFYASRPDIAKNPQLREALERQVIEMFKPTPDTPKEKLMMYMDMVASYSLPKVNRSAAARQASEKRDLVDFSGKQSSTETKTKGEIEGPEADVYKAAGLPTTGWLY